MSMNEETDSRRRADTAAYFTVSAFPAELWKEWDAGCKARFGDCRWIKMWNDHLRSKDIALYDDMIERIKDLEMIIHNKGIDSGKIKTLKGEV